MCHDLLTDRPSLIRLQEAFLSLLPRIEAHARICFRYLRCPHRKDDAVAETVALAWKWHLSLARRGKDARAFPATFASLAVRQVRCGRRLCGQEAGKDALSGLAQTRHSFVVCKLPDREALSANPLADALADNTASPVPEQVCFRIDFPRWLGTLAERDWRIARDMVLGHRTRELARAHGLSQGRISQLRRAFHRDWNQFWEDAADEG
jgi:hypothetical protein